MAARYYFKKSNEFKNFESMVVFLKTQEKGVLFVKDISGVKIVYDTKTGKVRLINAKEIKVINYFSYNIIHLITGPVADAICLLAKLDLLLQLDDLADERVSALVRKNHVDQNTGKLINIKHVALEKTFAQIIHHSRPRKRFFGFGKSSHKTEVQKAVYKVLVNFDYTGIKSKDIVLKKMAEIREYLGGKKEEVSSSPA